MSRQARFDARNLVFRHKTPIIRTFFCLFFFRSKKRHRKLKKNYQIFTIELLTYLDGHSRYQKQWNKRDLFVARQLRFVLKQKLLIFACFLADKFLVGRNSIGRYVQVIQLLVTGKLDLYLYFRPIRTEQNVMDTAFFYSF